MKEWFEPSAKRPHYKEDLERARSLGYKSLTECIRGLYQKHRSIRVGAKMLDMSRTCFRSHLRGMGEPVDTSGGSNFQNNPERTDVCDIRGCSNEFTTRDPRVRLCKVCGSRKARNQRNKVRRKSLDENVLSHRGAVSGWAIL